MPRDSDARHKLIRTAASLFRQRGYNGVGLNELLAASEAPKGSLYHHFPGGKEQLAEAALRFAGCGIAQLIDDTFAAKGDFASGVRALAAWIADWHERSGFREGCPVTSVLLDTVPQSEMISATVRAVFDDWEQRVIRHAQALGHTGFDRVDAQRLLILIEGAWIVARVRHSRQPMIDAAETFIGSLGKPSSGRINRRRANERRKTRPDRA